LGPEDGKARKIPLTGYFIWQVQQNNALNELADPFYYSTQGAVLRRSRHAFILLQKALHQFFQTFEPAPSAAWNEVKPPSVSFPPNGVLRSALN